MTKQSVLVSILGAVGIIGLAIGAVIIAIEHKPKAQIQVRSTALPKVEVHRVSVSAYAPIIHAQGTVTARYSGNLVAQVEGQVIDISDQLLFGRAFKQGEVLVRLDNTRYLSNEASAQSELAARTRDLTEERLRAQQAQADWKRAGIKNLKPSALTLREPQLKSAQAYVAAANAALALARQNLTHTQVRAPYAGSVITRQVSPGDYVQIGQTLAEIYAHRSLELTLPLSQVQINLLGNRNAIHPVTITVRSTIDPERQWSVRTWRLGRTVDQINRLQSLIVELETTAVNAPLPGEFLQASIEARQMNDLLELNQSSLARDGSIWYVNDQNELAVFNTSVVFRLDDNIYVKLPDHFTQLNIVRYPQPYFLTGTKVEPVFDAELSLTEQNLKSNSL